MGRGPSAGLRALLVLGACGGIRAFLTTPVLRTARPVRTALQAGGDITDADVAGRYFVEFACFGYANRFCTLTLGSDGLAEFKDGLQAGVEPGPWRIEQEEGVPYLQIIMPVKDIYQKLYNIPGEALFWRAVVEKAADGTFVGSDGKVISERKSLLGLKTDFILEGTFRVEPLTDQLEKEPMKGMMEKVEELRLATGQDKKRPGQVSPKEKRGKKASKAKGMGSSKK